MSDYHRSSTMTRGRIIALTVGALILVALGIVAGLAFNGNDETSASPGRSTPTPAQTPPPSSSACGLPDGDQTIPTSAPTSEWSMSHRMAAPSARPYGPMRSRGGIHACFAHNPVGALFAAANVAADSGNPDLAFKNLAEQRFVHDANYQAQRKDLDKNPPANGGLQYAGFRIDNYSPEAATIQLVVRATEGPNTGGLIAITYTMRWTNGDWRLALPPAGASISNPLTSLDGYVEWSGT